MASSDWYSVWTPQACYCGHTIVVYEVALSLLRLVRHYASRLDQREWETVYIILHATQLHLSQAAQVSGGGGSLSG